MKNSGLASVIISTTLRNLVFGIIIMSAGRIIKPISNGAFSWGAEISNSILTRLEGIMALLEILTQAFVSHLTMIIITLAFVACLQAALDTYCVLSRESSKAVHKFTYTSAMGESISVESSKPLEQAHLRGLISTSQSDLKSFHGY